MNVAGVAAKIGGALWTVWGIISLASALKDKTGPALQSAIWQIVGGIMIMVVATTFSGIIVDSTRASQPTTSQPTDSKVANYAGRVVNEAKIYYRSNLSNPDELKENIIHAVQSVIDNHTDRDHNITVVIANVTVTQISEYTGQGLNGGLISTISSWAFDYFH
jgi:hypothetical protein